MPKNRVTLWITLIRRKRIIHLLILAQDNSFCMHYKLGVFVQHTTSITAVNKSTQNQGSPPPQYHIKLALVTYSTWLQQSGQSSWDDMKSTRHSFQFYDHTSQLFKNLESVSLPLTPPLNRLPMQSIQDINPIPQHGFSTSDPNLPLENCVQQGERWVHSQDSPHFAVTKNNSLKFPTTIFKRWGKFFNKQIIF